MSGLIEHVTGHNEKIDRAGHNERMYCACNRWMVIMRGLIVLVHTMR